MLAPFKGLDEAVAVDVEPDPVVFDWAAGSVEVTTEDVAGIELVAVPSSTLK